MNRRRVRKNLFYYGGVIGAGLLWGIAMALLSDTVVNPWLPAGTGFAFGALCLPPAVSLVMRCRTCRPSRFVMVLDTLLYFAFMIPLGMVLMLGINSMTAKSSEMRMTEVVVAKHSETGSRYRTVGRRRVYQGEEHRYYVDLILPGGHTKKIRVATGRYVRTRSGRHSEVGLRRGCFGFDVIDSIPLKKD